MRPLPRLLAYLDGRIAARGDLGIGLAAIAAGGPAVALVARLPEGTTDSLAQLTARCVANARPPEAQVFVSGRIDVALAVEANGMIARRDDLAVDDLRAVAAPHHRTTILVSVHSIPEAREAVSGGADGLVVGTIWPSDSHRGQPAAGLDLIRNTAALGVPVFAIGGVSIDRARAARDAGAWGVAAIGALWDVKDHFQATMAMLRAVNHES